MVADRSPTTPPRQPEPGTPMIPRRALPLLLDLQGGRCAGCGTALAHRSRPGTLIPLGDGLSTPAPNHRPAEVDHLTPRSAGGRNVFGNYEAVCGPCNQGRYQEWRWTAVAL